MIQMFVPWRNQHCFSEPSVPGSLASQSLAGTKLGLSVLSWPRFSAYCQFSHLWNTSHLWNPVSEFVNHLGNLIIPFLCSTVFLILRTKSVLFIWEGEINRKRKFNKKMHSTLTLINLALGLQLWQVGKMAKTKNQHYISPNPPSFLRIKSQIKILMYQQLICL